MLSRPNTRAGGDWGLDLSPLGRETVKIPEACNEKESAAGIVTAGYITTEIEKLNWQATRTMWCLRFIDKCSQMLPKLMIVTTRWHSGIPLASAATDNLNRGLRPVKELTSIKKVLVLEDGDESGNKPDHHELRQ